MGVLIEQLEKGCSTVFHSYFLLNKYRISFRFLVLTFFHLLKVCLQLKQRYILFDAKDKKPKTSKTSK